MESVLNITNTDFENVLEEILKNLFGLSQSSTSIIKTAKEELQQLLLKHSFDLQKLYEFLSKQKVSQENLDFLIKVLSVRRADLLKSALFYLNSAHGENVTDFTWILKLVLGSSLLKSMREPVLQLLLTTFNGKDNDKKVLEFKKEDLSKLINGLESKL